MDGLRIYAFLQSYILWMAINTIEGNVWDEDLRLDMSFSPSEVDQLVEEHIANVTINYGLFTNRNVSLRVQSADTDIAQIHGTSLLTFFPTNESLKNDNSTRYNNSFQVKGIFLGRTEIIFSVLNASHDKQSSRLAVGDSKAVTDEIPGNGLPNDLSVLPYTYDVTIIREDGPLNTAFLVSIILLVVLANIAMGCKVELPVVKEILKKPLAPVIGLLSQFVIMPLLGFGASQAFRFDSGTALGLFATGCAPGGGASNAYTFLLNGDVSLSVTMTLISTISSFAFIPLWLFTIGTLVLYKDSDVRIPFENIFTSLIGLILPVGFGMLIRWKKPEWVKTILKAVTPLMVLALIVILSVGIYANLYIFKLLRPEVLIAGAILPNCGFILGGLAALIFRQPWKRVKTIAIETGLQNTGIPIVLLQVSLPKPDSDFAIVAPIASAIFTPILLWLWILIRFIRKRCFNKKSSLDVTKETQAEMDMSEQPVVDHAIPSSPSETPLHSPTKS